MLGFATGLNLIRFLVSAKSLIVKNIGQLSEPVFDSIRKRKKKNLFYNNLI